MLGRLQKILGEVRHARESTDPEERTRVAIAALLVEIARADHEDHPDEAGTIRGLLASYFKLDEAAAEDLRLEAAAAVETSVSLHEFTAPLHRSLEYPQKQAVIEMLWEVALGDRHLDKYEDYLVGKLADLLYVSRGDVIRLRHQVAERTDRG